MSASYDILIVGTGHAGANAAVSLRQLGFLGSIAVVGEEKDWPYERPPLSKGYLADDKPFESILLRQPGYWLEKQVDLLRGSRVVRVDPDDHTVTTDRGVTIGYGTMVWCTGGSARRLTCDGSALGGIHTVRTRADVDLMKDELKAVDRVAVVGGGYIGLEAAAALTSLGKAVTIVELQDRVLARVAGEPLSRFFEAEHRARGVDIRLGRSVVRVEGLNGRVAAVHLDDGAVVPCGMLIVGIGIVPEVQPLLLAGASGSNGVDVDEACRTSLANIYAVGDCAAHRNRYAAGKTVRVESVQNAVDQALVAAKSIMGQHVVYDAVPWFWSHQYDLKLQTAGLSMGPDEIVVRGDIGRRSFSVIYLKGSRLIALDCVNATKDYVQGKALIAAGPRLRSVMLADTSRSLKDIAVSAA